MREALASLATHAELKTSTSTCTANYLHGLIWHFDTPRQPGQLIEISSKTGFHTTIVERDLDGSSGILMFDEPIVTNGRFNLYLRSNGSGWHLCRCSLFVSQA